jgi:hypothetical protein
MKKFLTILGVFFFLLIIVVGIGYLSIRGKVPFISNKVFSQVDLGIDETPDEIYSYYDEIGYVDGLQGEQPKSGELVFEGTIDINHTFTQSEINSWLSAWEESWADVPFQNMQIKLNPDGTVEASALISVEKAETIGRMLGYTNEEIEEAKKYLGYVPDPLPLYATGRASITNNTVNLNVDDFKVSRLPLPGALINPVTNVISDIVARGTTIGGAQTYIREANVTAEGVEVLGKVPASVSIKE